jgi:hypothetical protein
LLGHLLPNAINVANFIREEKLVRQSSHQVVNFDIWSV